LYGKAKANPAYRFYALYDKIYRKDVLVWAWSCCRANGGSCGVDGQSFEGIEAKGVEAWLDQLATELKERSYRAQAFRRVLIPKPDGKQRPLGIPTVASYCTSFSGLLGLPAPF
jgi:RNA-directed DNA polymerase